MTECTNTKRPYREREREREYIRFLIVIVSPRGREVLLFLSANQLQTSLHLMKGGQWEAETAAEVSQSHRLESFVLVSRE